jgi:hypothetical protein
MPGHSPSKTGVNALSLPGIHVLVTCQEEKAWMAGTSPAMTKE